MFFHKKEDLFHQVIVKSFMGGIAGIICGFLLGLLIWALLYLVQSVGQVSPDIGPPVTAVEFLSMGIGAFIGVLLGAQTALKEK